VELKRCTGRCGQELPLSEFSIRADNGRPRSRCKKCRNSDHLDDTTVARSYYKANQDRILEGVRNRRKKYRLEALQHYSGGTPKCSCNGCTETHIEFLTIDHIGGGGSKHRRELSSPGRQNQRSPGGLAFYYWLRNNNYPEGFRVLCWNCNCSRGLHGYCPHEV
jgi:hypothetical protein